MDLSTITPLVLAFNEEPNLARTLVRLTWAHEVVVVDSGSMDATQRIARQHANVRLVERAFDNHSAQWNFGVDQIRTEWVLALDADYILEDGFEQELATLRPHGETAAYQVAFRYCIQGHPLQGTLYPPRLVLFRKANCRYGQDGHTQLLRANGSVGTLVTRVRHDDRKPLSHWLWSQDRYAKLEAEKLSGSPSAELGLNDRIRKTILLGPPVVFLYTLFLRGVILDGWVGWYYALQRALAETLLSLRLIEAKWMTTEPKVQSAKSKDAAD